MSISTRELPAASHDAGLSPLRKRRGGWTRYKSRTFYLFASPWILGFVLLTTIPMIYALLLSFTNFDGLSGNWHWVGLSNYRQIFQDPDALYSLLQTFLYALITVPLSLAGGLGLPCYSISVYGRSACSAPSFMFRRSFPLLPRP
jgi:multiple sugar transport system permease protein